MEGCPLSTTSEFDFYLQGSERNPTPTQYRFDRPYCCSSLERSEAQTCVRTLFTFSKLSSASQVRKGRAGMDRSHSTRSTYRRGRGYSSGQFAQYQPLIPEFSIAWAKLRQHSIIGGSALGFKFAGTFYCINVFSNWDWNRDTAYQTSFSSRS